VLLSVFVPSAAASSGLAARAAIVDGYVPHPSQWPWVAAIVWSDAGAASRPVDPGPTDFDRQFCGGTLIRPRVVLTAAHCVDDLRGPQDVNVIVGRRNLLEPVGEKLPVASIARHPQYRQIGGSGPSTALLNDVAVLHLAAPSTFAVATIRDPLAPRLREGDPGTVMGWGNTSATGNAFKEILRAADVPFWHPSRCKSSYPNYDARLMVCAGYINGRVDSCQGDSGGPYMVAERDGSWRLIGVVSFGHLCARRGYPGVYAWVNGPGIRQFIAGEAAKDPTPPGTATVPETPGSQPTAPPPGDRTAPRFVGRVRLGAGRRTLVARFRLSEPAQVEARVFNRRTRRLLRGPVRRVLRAGPGRISVRGRLRPGRYVLSVATLDEALNRSARIVGFRVRR
jgi:hypothetical protein